MVEELKLAIKIDDASIEQSLLKQFANAQKMADKVVLDFRNVNFDDKQIEAKFKEMQKKAGQNPIDLTISDNALDMLGQIDKRLTEIFSIGKGKSFIDSSSITADIGKIENKINELDKKYEEAQKKLSSIGSGNISGKDVNLVDNEEFKKLSQEVSELKNQFDDLKTHMHLLDDYTVPTDRFFELQSQVEATTVKVSDLVDEFTKLSNAQKALSSTPQESNISSGSNPTPEVSQNNNISDSIQKKKEALASYELQLEETRYEVEKLSNAESKLPYGFNRTYNDEKTASMRDRVTDIVLGNNSSSSERSGSKKWYALGNLANIDASALKTYQMWQEELQKVGYTLSEIRDTSVGLTADIIPIDGKAITNAEEFRKTLDSITTLPSKNVQLLNQQITELESKISSLKSEIASLGSPASNQRKDAFPDKDISASVDSATNSIKEENNVLEQNTQKVKENTQAKEQNANVNFNKYDKRLDSYNGKIDKYKTTIDRFNDGGWTSDEYLKNVQAVKDAVKEYETLLNELKGKDASLVTSDDINRLDNYEKKIKDTIATVTNMSAAEKGYNFVSGQKELDKIHKLLNENSKMSSEAKAKIRAYYTEIESGNPSMSLDRIHGEIMKIYNAEVEAGRAGRSFFDTLKNSGFHKLAAQMSGMFGFYDVINIGKQAISTIVSLDDALLDLKKTTSMSSTELNNFYYSANDVAKQMGVTTKSIIEQASAWSRLGYSSNEQATEMAKLSSKFASISPGMDTDQAQEGMVSIMKAWQINPEDVEKEILDPINQLGNKFAESNNDIVEGMKRSAAALAAVGTDYKDAYSLFTGVQEVLQNSEVAGRALRSISMRIRGYDENSEDGFEQTDDELKNITGDLIDLTKTAQHAQGVSIFKEGSTTEFKSLVDYFGEIHDIWDEMSQKQQNDFLQKAFGKTQAQAGAALIQNYDAVKEALAEIDESAGSADKEMSTVEQTLSYKINALKETWVGCAQQILDRGDLGIAISGLNGVSKVITGLIDNVGLLKTAAMGVAATLSFKNVGGNKMHFPMNILDNIHNLLWIQRFRVCYP